MNRWIIILLSVIGLASFGQAQNDRCSRVTGPFYDCEDNYVHCPTSNITLSCQCYNTVLNCFSAINCMDEPVVKTYQASCRTGCPPEMCEAQAVPMASSPLPNINEPTASNRTEPSSTPGKNSGADEKKVMLMFILGTAFFIM